jgi:hypothetical protein
MRTAIILVSGLLVFAGLFFYSRLFTQHYPDAPAWATYGFIAVWFVASAFNMWVGITHAGYAIREELPIMLVLFAVPVAIALVVRWKLA